MPLNQEHQDPTGGVEADRLKELQVASAARRQLLAEVEAKEVRPASTWPRVALQSR
jgi:hypothetical protein